MTSSDTGNIIVFVWRLVNGYVHLMKINYIITHVVLPVFVKKVDSIDKVALIRITSTLFDEKSCFCKNNKLIILTILQLSYCTKFWETFSQGKKNHITPKVPCTYFEIWTVLVSPFQSLSCQDLLSGKVSKRNMSFKL